MSLVHPLDEIQGPSQLHGYGPWLVCEVALTSVHKFATTYGGESELLYMNLPLIHPM